MTEDPETQIGTALARISEENRATAAHYLASRPDVGPSRKARMAKLYSLVDLHVKGLPWTQVPGAEYRAWLNQVRGEVHRQTWREYGRYLRGLLRWLDNPAEPIRGRLPDGFAEEFRKGKGGNAPHQAYWGEHDESAERRDAKDALTQERTLDGMSPASASDLRRFLDDRRLRMKIAQERKYATALASVDRALNATPWRQVTPEQIRAYKLDLAKRVVGGTLSQHMCMVQAVLKWCHDPDELPKHRRLPKGFAMAFVCGFHPDIERGRRIPDDHFMALLEATQCDLATQGLLWVLRDCGFRIGEALSLNVGSVHDDGDKLRFELPPRAQARFRLKTGPRTIWTMRCKAAILALKQDHPLPNRDDAPLFLTRQNQEADAPYLPLGPAKALHFLKQACGRAEVGPDTPHDFRHTRAYECKQNDWCDDKMIGFFGWRPNSKMPSKYGRLVAAEHRANVRRDAGVNNLGQKIIVSDADQKLRLISQVMKLIADPGTAVPAELFMSLGLGDLTRCEGSATAGGGPPSQGEDG